MSAKKVILITGSDLADAALGMLEDYELVFAGRQPTEAQLMDSATHDEVIDKLIRDVILYLGVAIANEDNLVRPESILVDAPYFVHQKYRELFMDTLYKYSFRPSHFRFHIIFLNRDELPGAKSAAAVAIRSDFDKYIAI